MSLRTRSRIAWRGAAFAFALFAVTVHAQDEVSSDSDTAASLRTRYEALSEQIAQSPLHPGLYVESIERSRSLQGDVYALVDYPFSVMRDAFSSPANWCEALILHLNIKYCRESMRDGRPMLSVALGKKTDQPLSETYRVEFDYDSNAPGADFVQTSLQAKKGPLGTKNYRIDLEMVAVEAERTFVHIRFSCTTGFLSRFASGIYLGGSGKDKVGFSLVAAVGDDRPRFIGGMRGAVERNTMRYFLAIDAYLSALATPPPQRFEESAERWFAATERYALQLHEIDRDSYLAMKHAEYLRQRTPP